MNFCFIAKAALLLCLLTSVARGQSVVINELFYHAPSGDRREEFIELYNPNLFPVDLSGASIVRGISFTFTNISIPPQGYLVVAADPEVFQSKHPGIPAVGPWEGQLGNRGETITLVDLFKREMDSVSYADDGDWAVRTRGPLDLNHTGWIWSAPHDGGGKSLELTGHGISNQHGQLWEASLVDGGTPGQVNSVAKTNVAPVITRVIHRPPVPRPQDPVTISASILDESATGVSVFLHHRFDGAAEFSVTEMLDDGEHGDQAPSDKVFGAVLSPAPDKTVVEFYLRAVDPEGNERTWPRFVQPDNASLANLLYQVSSTIPTTTEPVYRLIMTQQEREEFMTIITQDHHSNARMNGTFISHHDGRYEVRYQVGIRHRGQGSRFKSPNNFRVEFTGDARWQDSERINLNADNSIIQVLGAAVARNAGFLAGRARLAQVLWNDQDRSRPGPSMFGFYAHNEVLDSDFANENLLGSANLYRGIRTGTDEASFVYRGDDPDLYRHVFFKETNQGEDDWSDFIELTRVLTLTPDAQYTQELRRVIDVDQWLSYFVFSSLVANSETALGNGFGDDYYMYADTLDGRFRLIPYDHDSYFGQGDEHLPPETPVFTALRTQLLIRFLTWPEFAARYYEIMLEMLDGWFTEDNLFPLIDQILGEYAPDTALDPIKQWITSRRAFLKAEIPQSLTIITTNLTPYGDAFEISTPTVSLNGRANPVTTRKVLVNGAPASWSAWEAKWSFPNVPFRTGPNRVVVQALDASGQEIDRASIDVHYLGTPPETTIGGPLSANLVLEATSPYRVAENLVVGENVSLTIEAGTTLFFEPGVRLLVRGNLKAQGSPSARIRMTTAAEDGAPWEGIQFQNSLGTNALAFLDFDSVNPGQPAIEVFGSVLHLDNCTWARAGPVIAFSESSLRIQNCHFPPATNANILSGTGIASPGYLVVTNNIFRALQGSAKAISLLEAQPPSPILECYQNTFMGGEASGIELRNAAAHIEGNLFTNFQPQSNTPLRSRTPAAIDSFGTASLTAARNVFASVSRAISISGAAASIHHNTFVDTSDGVQFLPAENFPAGYEAKLIGNIFSTVTTPISGMENLPSPAAARVEYCLFPEGELLDGIGNLEGDARLLGLPALAALAPGSAALKRSRVGFDMGANIPSALSIDPLPLAFSPSSNLVLQVWGPGFTHYCFSLNDAPYGELIPISAPLVLSNLVQGPQTLALLGLNSAGRLQAIASASVFDWNISYDATSVLMSEIFAGGSPSHADDWIELHNTTAEMVDLSGYSLSDDLAIPRKFVFPPGTTLPGGGYLKVARNAMPSGLQLSFAINQAGDAIHLFASDLLVDSVSFGTQLPSFSIGRVREAWVLTQLTPGLPNLRATLGDPSQLLINEWYTTGISDSDPDFVELFNPEQFPVSLAGLGLSDHPQTAPFAHVFPPLSFMPANSARAFIANGTPQAGPSHLPFRLSRDQGVIGLTAPDRTLIDWVWYGPQRRGLSEGRPASQLDSFAFFSGRTPGTSNPGGSPSQQIRLNEILADNRSFPDAFGRVFSWVELFNPSSLELDLSGMALSDDASVPYKWIVPDGTVIPAQGYLVIPAYPLPEAGTRATTGWARGATLYLFDRLEMGGSLLDVVAFGFQAADFSLGRDPNMDSLWKIGLPTPGEPNLPVPTGQAQELRINEWLAQNSQGDDWLEIYNPEDMPVDMSGLQLSEDWEDLAKSIIPPYSFIGSGFTGYKLFIANGEAARASDEAPFKLSKDGESIILSDPSGGIIDHLRFGPQPSNISQGRFPDGASAFQFFPASTSPGAPNFVDLDNDALPDNWEIQFGFDPTIPADFTDDPDADGFTNLAEFRAGTDPLKADSFLSISTVQFGPQGAQLQFEAIAHRAYSIQSTLSLENTSWEEELYLPPRPVSEPLTVILDNQGAPIRFFRVQAIAPAPTAFP